MISWLSNQIRSRLLRIEHSEVTFQKRGFPGIGHTTQSHLEEIGHCFLLGYEAAMTAGQRCGFDELIQQLDREYHGFAFEGAAMGYALIDAFCIRGDGRWKRFLEGRGSAHRYVLHVGVGWVVARLPWLRLNPHRIASRLDPLLRWLVFDGYGFHQGYFGWERWLQSPRSEKRLQGYASRAFDQGLGRSLWFVAGTDAERIAYFIEKFEPVRRSDLWSGVGLAVAYAGKPTVEQLEVLISKAGEYVAHVRQGIAFGAEARELGEIQTEHTNQTCLTACGMSAKEVALVTYAARENLPNDTSARPAYEEWRSNVRVMLDRGLHSCV